MNPYERATQHLSLSFAYFWGDTRQSAYELVVGQAGKRIRIFEAGFSTLSTVNAGINLRDTLGGYHWITHTGPHKKQNLRLYGHYRELPVGAGLLLETGPINGNTKVCVYFTQEA